MSLLDTVRELCRAVDGVDWNADRVDLLFRDMLTIARKAPYEELDAAVAVIAERLAVSRVEDADGVAHVAFSGASLVEQGAVPGPLGEVLIAKLPAVLSAARAFADRCLVHVRERDDPWEGVDDYDLLAEVDALPIVRKLYRRQLREDRGGGCSLAYLREWVHSAVAAWTRDREVHARATKDEALRAGAAAMQRSDAHALHMLAAAQLDATWRVLCPDDDRGFLLRVDSVTNNVDLLALVSDVLVRDAGIPGMVNPTDVLDVIRGAREKASRDYVMDGFDFHTHRAAEHLRGAREAMPDEHVVSGDGVPTDVPEHDGVRTLIATEPTRHRTWTARRYFPRLEPSVTVERELAADEIRELLASMRGA